MRRLLISVLFVVALFAIGLSTLGPKGAYAGLEQIKNTYSIATRMTAVVPPTSADVPLVATGILNADGHGNITSGHETVNVGTGPSYTFTFTGTYTITDESLFTGTMMSSLTFDQNASMNPFQPFGSTTNQSLVVDSFNREVRLAETDPKPLDFTLLRRQHPGPPFSMASLDSAHNGEYGFGCQGVLTGTNPNNPGFTPYSMTGLLTFNGDGTYVGSDTTMNTAEVITTFPSFNGTYSVNADGSFTMSSLTSGFPNIAGAIELPNQQLSFITTDSGNVAWCFARFFTSGGVFTP